MIKRTVHDDIKWIGVKEIQKFDLCPADIPIAKRLYFEVL
jgi:hypothetical protein